MATQQVINELRQGELRHLGARKMINNDINQMEERQIKKWSKMAELGSEVAMTGLKQWKEHRGKKNRAQAMNDWMKYDLGDYVGSDAYKKSVEILNSSSEASNNMHEDLKVASDSGMPAHVQNRIAKGDPEYARTIANLSAIKISRDFTPFITNGMTSSEELVDRGDGTGSFAINAAQTLEEKMLAHDALKTQFLEANNLYLDGNEGLGFGYHSILKDDGGPGTFESIIKQETGPDGLFASYELQAAIAADKKRRAVATQALYNTPNKETWSHYFNTLKIGRTEDGARLDYDKIHKIMRTSLENGLKSGHIGYSHVIEFSDTVIPGTKSKEFPKGQTWGQKFPSIFGYDPENGIEGTMFTFAHDQEKDNLAASDARKLVTSEADIKDGVNAILKSSDGVNYDISAKDLQLIKKNLHNQYRDVDGVDWTPLDDAETMFRKSPLETQREINNLLEWHKKTKGLLTNRLTDMSLGARKHPEIARILREEASYMAKQDYKDAIKDLEQKPEQVIKTLGVDKIDGHLGDVKIIQHALTDKFHQLVKSGVPVTEARGMVDDWFIKYGGNNNYENDSKAKADGKESNMFSLNSNGKLISSKLKETYAIPKLTEVDTYTTRKTSIEDHQRINGGSKLDALSNDGSSAFNIGALQELEPGYKLVVKQGETPETTIFETKELAASYNKTLWETRKVPQHLLDTARALNMSVPDVINARLNAWGLPELDKKTMGIFEGHEKMKYLPKGAYNEIYGNRRGLYHPAEISKFIMSTPDATSTTVAEMTGYGNFVYAAENEGADGLTANFTAALFKATFGDDALNDTTHGGASDFTQAVFQNLNPEALDAFTSDPAFLDAYAGFTGQPELLSLHEGLEVYQQQRIDRLREELKALSLQRQRNYDLGNVEEGSIELNKKQLRKKIKKLTKN